MGVTVQEMTMRMRSIHTATSDVLLRTARDAEV
jgi:hypothetical protein